MARLCAPVLTRPARSIPLLVSAMTLAPFAVAVAVADVGVGAAALAQPVMLRQQRVAPLPGGLDGVLVVNDNNPELITAAGILLSTFAGQGRGVPDAHLDTPLDGRFDLFSHHVYAGKPESLDSTLWLAVVAQPRGSAPVTLRLLAGSTALSQSLDPSQPGAPFLPLPTLLPQGLEPAYAGPGSRVATELLSRQRSPLLPPEWTLAPGQLSTAVQSIWRLWPPLEPRISRRSHRPGQPCSRDHSVHGSTGPVSRGPQGP